jgi:hypothetical protein
MREQVDQICVENCLGAQRPVDRRYSMLVIVNHTH